MIKTSAVSLGEEGIEDPSNLFLTSSGGVNVLIYAPDMCPSDGLSYASFTIIMGLIRRA
jgi:hypothetical protein